MDLYDQVCGECSKLITNRYSTSFSLGIKSLPKRYHESIYGIYGFVRFADEIVDTFHQSDKTKILDKFRLDTLESIKDKISLNPVLHSFQLVVNSYNIKTEWIEAFLKSMEMDLTMKTFSDSEYKEYIFGSAEVIGLMCLQVFCDGNADIFSPLEKDACALGSAFQKVNFLRDMKADFEERGRVYFPNVSYSSFSKSDKNTIEEDIQKDFDQALNGIKNLPNGCKTGVYAAYTYYLALFEKIKKSSTKDILSKRIRVSDAHKMLLLLKSTAQSNTFNT